jgi:hypothetical protein
MFRDSVIEIHVGDEIDRLKENSSFDVWTPKTPARLKFEQ